MARNADPDRARLAQLARAHPTAWAIFLSRYGGDGTWENAAHFDYLADEILAMRRGELQRLCVSMPPGSGKSEYLSLAVASWWLGTRPRSRVVIASYGRSLSIGWSARARDAIARLGPEVFGVGADERATRHWWQSLDPVTNETLGGGYFFAVGRGGPLTGMRAELLVVDDLLKDDMEANSPATRDHAWRWFDKVAMTRLLPHSCVCVVSTRWHALDLIGRLEVKQREGRVELPWKFIDLPALAVEGDPLGREPGEALWPAMWPADRLLLVKQGRDPYTWAALFQGRPVPEGGGLFKSEWLRYYRESAGWLLAEDDERLRVRVDSLIRFATVDLAGSKKQRADFTVVSVWGVCLETRTLWLLACFRDRLESPQIVEELKRIKREHSPTTFYMEDAGPQLNLYHRMRYAEQAGEALDVHNPEPNFLASKALDAGVPVIGIPPIADKTTRAGPATAVMSHARMLLPREEERYEGSATLQELLRELLTFPEAAHDDMVDTISYGAEQFAELLRAHDHLKRRREYEAGSGGNPIGGSLL